MADEEGTKRDAGPAAGRRRGPVTIDLPAEEIKRTAPGGPAPEGVPVSTVAEDASRSGSGGPAGPEHGGGGTVADPPPRSGSPASMIGFAVMGALVVLLGGYLLMFTDWLPSPGRNTANEALAETERLDGEIEALRQAVGTAPDLEPLAARVAALEDVTADLGEIREAIGALIAADDANRAARAEIITDLDALQREFVAGAAAAGDPEAAAQLAEDINALSARIALLENAGPPEQLFELQRQIDGIEAAVAALTDETAALTAEAAERDRAAGAARLLAFNNVQAAAIRGDVFVQELAILVELGVGGDAALALEDAAATGVPSRAELADAFDDVASAILTATREVDPDAGFWDRLWDNARGIVTVTPTVPVEGDTPAAIVSRMRAAIDAGDVETALAERLALPEVALAASAEWASDAEARLALDAALANLAAAVQAGQAG